MEESNRKRMDVYDSKKQDFGKIYNIDIGRKSELEKK